MTKEQEEAIEILEGMVKSYIEADECGLSNNDFKHEIRAMQTVLSMLKEKDKEIEFQKDIRNTEKNRNKKTEKSLKGIINKQNTELAEKNAEIETLNRQIDLMAEAMDKIQDPQVCKYCDNKINLNYGYCVDAGKCKEGIKQYFERKATNKG